MIEIAPIEELREVRRRLSEVERGDVAKYAAMLRQVAKQLPGEYVSAPLSDSDATLRPQTVEA